MNRLSVRLLFVVVLCMSLVGAAPHPAAAQASEGWHAEYYANPHLIGAPALTRIDGLIEFQWGTGTPDPSMTGDSFSARWTRYLDLTAGAYTFYAATDDGVRVFVDDRLLIDAWQPRSVTTDQATIDLAGGQHALRVEYFDAGGAASANIWWEQAASPTPTPTAQPTVTPPAQKTPTGGQTTYVVRSGDTLARIAARFGVTVAAIMAANPIITNPDRIRVGQRLIIPARGTQPPTTTFSQVRVYLISEGTGSVGCGDEVVGVRRNITPTTAPLTAALNQLFSIKTRDYGQSGLYNPLYQSNLAIQEITRTGTSWTVKLTGTLVLGGVCDNPRVEAQLRQTALQFDTVKQVKFLINGVPLEQLLSGR